jgi:alkylation response protein AidB-like acyl-CoA dehydrogenase
MNVERLLPTPEACDLVRLAADVAGKVLDPIVDEHEKNESYPEDVFATLGETGLLTLPHPEQSGRGGQPRRIFTRSPPLELPSTRQHKGEGLNICRLQVGAQ